MIIVIEPEDPIGKQLPSTPHVVVGYTREIPPESEAQRAVHAFTERIFPLSPTLEAKLELPDYMPSTLVRLNVTTAQGVSLIVRADLEPARQDGEDAPFTLHETLTESEVTRIRTALTPNNPQTTRVLLRAGRFVVIGGPPPAFRDFTLLVSPVAADQLPADVLAGLFGIDGFRTVAKRLTPDELATLSGLQLGEVHTIPLSLQGTFELAVPVDGSEAGWFWLLTGPIIFAGLREETDLGPSLKTATILLPMPAGAVPETSVPGSPASGRDGHDHGSAGRPTDATEDELLESPGLFSDDPGSFCKPFQNPNRIVGERSFHTILRVTQPEIGGDPSVPPSDTLPTFPFSPGLLGTSVLTARERASGSSPAGERLRLSTGLTSFVSALNEAAPDSPMISTRAALAERRRYVLANSRGRGVLNSKTALEWEGDSTIYQATSLGLGHILEFRVRWRSNGYSLGSVAHTLTLAPRQTRRIVTVESRILDRMRRRETTQVTESVAQETRRDYAYSDAVQSHLSEWARGGSRASTTGAAGGFGFALGGFVIGGGASHGQSNTSSWALGGRDVAAAEEQSLRDAIRQYGESLRKMESMVVVEQSQEEFVQAVSEVVRNPNYCHSLTIIYHEILRHLRVDTEVVGARECVFVPLAIRPFTLERVIRWRDILERGLLKPELRWVMRYLEDVNENFATGTIPVGRRSQQPIRFLTGSITLQLAIERPKDNDDGSLNEVNWRAIAPFTNLPIRQVFARLQEQAAARRDALFQRDNAPTIAANWINRLRLSTPTGPLTGADFTLASKYQFNRTLRIDFTYTPDGTLTRENLQQLSVTVPDDAPLPPSSVANVRQVEIHYYTDTFDHSETSPTLANDLINVEDGTPETQGAAVFIKLSDWERQDLRSIIRGAAEDLITHLNEHVELYQKRLWWELDRDKLYMMLDSIYVLNEADGRSVASVVEREPVAIMGNSLVYRVAAGAHLKVDGHETPDDLNRYYRDTTRKAEPTRISLPTSGLYAQSIMDECEACEEHFGSTEWVLSDDEPELAELGADAIRSRRAVLPEAAPSQLPTSIINLQNAPNVPAPAGLADVLGAVQNANAFRDMAGLAGTQANARAAMEAAANLANQFGARAVELRKAEMSAKLAKEKLAAIDKAHQKGAIDDGERQEQAKRALDEMNHGSEPAAGTEELVRLTEVAGRNGADISRQSATGETIRVNASGTAFDVGRSFIIEGPEVKPENRAFNPTSHDKKGRITMSVRVPELPAGGRVRWAVSPNAAGHTGSIAFALGGGRKANVQDGTRVEILGLKPGRTAVDVEVRDAGNTTIESQKYQLMVPQFVSVDENTNFDAVLGRFGLEDSKADILLEVKATCENLLSDANVRTVWMMAPFDEKLPAHLTTNLVTKAEIAGDPTGTGATPGLLGLTTDTSGRFVPGADLGPTHFDEIITIFPGAMTSTLASDLDDRVVALIQALLATPFTSTPERDLAVTVVGRIIGTALAHEILHALIGFAFAGNAHTNAARDLVAGGRAFNFEHLTGVQVTDEASFPAPGSFVDIGRDHINRPQVDGSLPPIEASFPVPPAFD